MKEKNNIIMYVGIAIMIIVVIIVVWFVTKKKEDKNDDDDNGDNGNDEHIPPFDEDHPGYTGAEFVETYKGYDIWHWPGKPNPYIVFTTIRQWFETLVQARNRISNHVGY